MQPLLWTFTNQEDSHEHLSGVGWGVSLLASSLQRQHPINYIFTDLINWCFQSWITLAGSISLPIAEKLGDWVQLGVLTRPLTLNNNSLKLLLDKKLIKKKILPFPPTMKLIFPIKEIQEEAASLKKNIHLLHQMSQMLSKNFQRKNFTSQNLNIWAIDP